MMSAIKQAKELAKDLQAQERANARAPRVARYADAYIRAVGSDHGEEIVFVPGEALPQWVVDELDAGRCRVDDAGVRHLTDEVVDEDVDDPLTARSGRSRS